MRISALFNLKEDARRSDYESWARGRDLPTVSGLPSVENFQVLRTRNVLFSDDKPPFDYIEIIDVSSKAAFVEDFGGDASLSLARRHPLQALSASPPGGPFEGYGGKVSGSDGAASLLGVAATTLYSRIAQFGVLEAEWAVTPRAAERAVPAHVRSWQRP